MDYIKSFIDFLSAPTISFTLLTVIFPFIFPPNDWFNEKSKKWGIYKLWTNTGGLYIFLAIPLLYLKYSYPNPNFIFI